MSAHLPFDNTAARLPERFSARLAPTPVRAPKLIRLNRDLAVHLGLDPARLASPEGVEVLAGNRVPDGAEPIALAYAGHQFGHFVPQLGESMQTCGGNHAAAALWSSFAGRKPG